MVDNKAATPSNEILNLINGKWRRRPDYIITQRHCEPDGPSLPRDFGVTRETLNLGQ